MAETPAAVGAEERPRFTLPYVEDNADGWGPVSTPRDLEGMPYAPYSKSDKIGRIADWNIQNPRGRQIDSYRDRLYNTGIQNQMFSYFQDEDETSFQLVDNRTRTRGASTGGFRPMNRNFQRGGQRGGNNFQRLDRNNRGGANGGGRGGNNFFGRGGPRGGRRFQAWRDFDKPAKMREHSIEAKPDWEELDEIAFSRLASLQIEPPEAEDLLSAGSVAYYDRQNDRITTMLPKPLRQSPRVFHNVTTSDDPKIREFADAGEGNVFAIDSVIALLMTCSRSVYSWDVVVNRVGNNLFLDKRERSSLDFLTVSETAAEPPADDPKDLINAPDALSHEATYINRTFSQQVVRSDERLALEGPNPFVDGSEDVPIASVGYRYRKWQLGEGVKMVVRCEVDAVQRAGNQELFMTVKALNEFDSKQSGVDWRQKLDSQRGAVLATELKNNGSKLARWTAQSLLAGADILKLGFVSRMVPRDASKHVIIGTQVYKPLEFATQMNLSLPNAWGVVKALIDLFLALPEGKYLLLKDPAKPSMRLFKIPVNALDKDDDEEAQEQTRVESKGMINMDDDDDV